MALRMSAYAGSVVSALLFSTLAGPVGDGWANTRGEAAEPRQITVVEQTGVHLPLETVLVDENGVSVSLGSLIDKPTIVLPIYFTCPNSCSVNLANLAVAMGRMKLQAGVDYRAVALSFADQETAEDARRAKNNYLRLLGDNFPEDQWTFLTGDRPAIDAVLETIGFSYKELADGTYIHPSMLAVVTADGIISKYVYGSFIPGDVEIALSEARRGVVATSIKRFLDYCFNYDPAATNLVFQTVKLVTLAVFGGGLVWFFIRFIRRRA